jgi:peptidoglycan hydrolase CwlO-like protein
MQITELEGTVSALQQTNQELSHTNERFRDQAARSQAAVSNASEMQKRLEEKYTKRTRERDAARDESKAAQARVAELKV